MSQFSQSLAQENDESISSSIERSFYGTARINLKYLCFDEEQEIDLNNVARLRRIFNQEGCLRLQQSHRIPAVINTTVFERAILQNGLQREDLLHPRDRIPHLKLANRDRIICLHGQHRIEAARQFLPLEDEWWVIDLYSVGRARSSFSRRDLMVLGLGQKAKGILREEYANASNFSDGEIYSNIRFYQEKQMVLCERRWWAYLSRNKSINLRRILLRPKYVAAFDVLRPAQGLWPSFRLGDFHTLLALRCDEEILHYISYIRQVWEDITDRRMNLIDRVTVETLQLRAPGTCEIDKAEILNVFDNRPLFRHAKGEIRLIIRENLSKTYVMIPSFYTFFEDIKFIRPCAKAMQSLVDAPWKGTIYQMMERMYEIPKPNQILVQHSEQDFEMYSAQVPQENQFQLAYQQLWLFAMRSFPQLVPEGPRKEKLLRKPLVSEPSAVAQHAYGNLADRLGFSSRSIDKLTTLRPIEEITRSLISKEWPWLNISSGIEAAVAQDLGRLEGIETENRYQIRKPTATPQLVVEHHGETHARRCGRYFQKAYEYDRHFLFLPNVWPPITGIGMGLSSFLVRKCVYLAFFGDVPWGNHPTSTKPQRSNDVDVKIEDEKGKFLQRSPDKEIAKKSIGSPYLMQTMSPTSEYSEYRDSHILFKEEDQLQHNRAQDRMAESQEEISSTAVEMKDEKLSEDIFLQLNSKEQYIKNEEIESISPFTAMVSFDQPAESSRKQSREPKTSKPPSQTFENSTALGAFDSSHRLMGSDGKICFENVEIASFDYCNKKDVSVKAQEYLSHDYILTDTKNSNRCWGVSEIVKVVMEGNLKRIYVKRLHKKPRIC